MLSLDYTREVIGLEEGIVTGVKQTETECFITLEMPRREHPCPSCGTMTDQIHDYRMQPVKDIPAFGRYVTLLLRKRRYRCPDCGKRFREPVSFLPKYHRMTNRLSSFVVNELRKVYSMKDVAERTHVSATTAARIFDFVSFPDISLPKVLSIDEFRGNAGGEKFQCILTNPKERKTLDVLPSRRSEDLYAYFSRFPDRNRVEYIVMDMSPLFRSVMKSCFPRAILIADHYHVKRLVIWAFELVRKEEQKKFSDQRRKYFKQSRKVLLKDPERLTEMEQDQVAAMLSISERLRYAYALKTEFSKVMLSKDSLEGKRRLGIWCMMAQSYRTIIPEFNACFTTFNNWQKEILASFDHPYTNGYTEGVNNKIKVIKRNAYGVRNFERFRNRILHVMAA